MSPHPSRASAPSESSPGHKDSQTSTHQHQQCPFRVFWGSGAALSPPARPAAKTGPSPAKVTAILSPSVCRASLSGCPGKEAELTLLGIIMLEICPWQTLAQGHCSEKSQAGPEPTVRARMGPGQPVQAGRGGVRGACFASFQSFQDFCPLRTVSTC